MAEVDVFSWPGQNQLPSFDPLCLSVVAYSRFCEAPVRFLKCRSYHQYSGDLPMVYEGDKTIRGAHKVIDYLRSKGWNADYNLKPEEKADTVAFLALIRNQLHPAILYLQFVDTQNYVDGVRGYFAGACSFPWSFYIPGLLQRQAKEIILLRKSDAELSDSSFQKIVVDEAKHCLNLLSAFLGDKDFFFGERPTSLDAVVYGYTSFLLHCGLPSNVLKPFLSSLGNITSFVTQINERFMKGPTEVETVAVPVPRQSFSDETKARVKKWASLGIGLIAMVTYAFASGLVKIEVQSEEATEDEAIEDNTEKE